MSKKPKILMFENDTYLGNLYFKKFSLVGFEVKLFKDFSNVVEKVAKEEPDILFVDIKIPEEDETAGLRAIEALKQDERTKDVPVVIVSNVDDKERMTKGEELGAVMHLVKVRYTPAELVRIFIKQIIASGKFSKEDFSVREIE